MRIIFHIDVNAAFLSWTAAYRCQVLGIFKAEPQRPNPARRGADTEDFNLLLLLRHDGASFL